MSHVQQMWWMRVTFWVAETDTVTPPWDPPSPSTSEGCQSHDRIQPRSICIRSWQLMTNAHHSGSTAWLVSKHERLWEESGLIANDRCARNLRDCHTYNDVCFKGQITSRWWKCISPCFIIIGTHCSHLHCAWLQFSHFSAWGSERMVLGGRYCDLHNEN